MQQADGMPHGSNAPSELVKKRSMLEAALQRISFAYSRCFLCIEGSCGFEHSMADQVSMLYNTARHSNIALQYFFSSGAAATQVYNQCKAVACTPSCLVGPSARICSAKFPSPPESLHKQIVMHLHGTLHCTSFEIAPGASACAWMQCCKHSCG